MPSDLVERRLATRRIPDPNQALSRVRLRTGRELQVIDISASGALVEGTTRLLPGTHVEVHVTSSRGRVLSRSRVVWCVVWRLTAEEIRYRGALAFGVTLDVAAEGYLLPEAPGHGRSDSGDTYPPSSAEAACV